MVKKINEEYVEQETKIIEHLDPRTDGIIIIGIIVCTLLFLFVLGILVYLYFKGGGANSTNSIRIN